MAYEAPKTEALELLAEGVICQSFSSKGTEFMTTDEDEDF